MAVDGRDGGPPTSARPRTAEASVAGWLIDRSLSEASASVGATMPVAGLGPPAVAAPAVVPPPEVAPPPIVVPPPVVPRRRAASPRPPSPRSWSRSRRGGGGRRCVGRVPCLGEGRGHRRGLREPARPRRRTMARRGGQKRIAHPRARQARVARRGRPARTAATASVGPVLTMISPNCSGSLEPAQGVEGQLGRLVGRGRRLPDLPRRKLHVLAADRPATSKAVIPRAAIFCGSSQARML